VDTLAPAVGWLVKLLLVTKRHTMADVEGTRSKLGLLDRSACTLGHQRNAEGGIWTHWSPSRSCSAHV